MPAHVCVHGLVRTYEYMYAVMHGPERTNLRVDGVIGILQLQIDDDGLAHGHAHVRIAQPPTTRQLLAADNAQHKLP
jgi:hypothetical protein